MQPSLELGPFTLAFSRDEGFRLFSLNDVFSEESYRTLQRAFDDVDWREDNTALYSQYQSFVLPPDGHALTRLFDPSFFFPFKSKLEQLLGVSLRNKIRLVARKLVTSHQIGPHNDYTDPELGCACFRFVFQFSRPNQLTSGGELTFLKSKHKDEVVKQYPYGSNTGICFEITPESFHYVTAVEGERHTLVMSLWPEGGAYNGTGIEVTARENS